MMYVRIRTHVGTETDPVVSGYSMFGASLTALLSVRVVKLTSKMYLKYSYSYSYKKVPRHIPRYTLQNVFKYRNSYFRDTFFYLFYPNLSEYIGRKAFYTKDTHRNEFDKCALLMSMREIT